MNFTQPKDVQRFQLRNRTTIDVQLYAGSLVYSTTMSQKL